MTKINYEPGLHFTKIWVIFSGPHIRIILIKMSYMQPKIKLRTVD